jgi:signal transduction histidine kinase
MQFKHLPIKKKLMRIIALISGVVLIVTCTTFLTYEFYKFRQTTIEKLSTIGKIIADNGTAALAFANQEDAKEILSSLKSEPHIVAACFYDKNGNLFAEFTSGYHANKFPDKPGLEEFHFTNSYLEGFVPAVEGTKHLGTLYLQSDLREMYDRFLIYGIITLLVIVVCFILVYLLSGILQKNISIPVLSLAETAKVVSDQKDYSVRAVKSGNDELGSLTDAFNQMLGQIQGQSQTLLEFNQQLERKVMERTRELETANKELEQFVYVASHDLQEPLRTISNFAGLFKEEYSEKLDAETSQYLKFIITATSKMQNLIKDLLDFSRIGRKITYVTVNCNELLKEIIADMNASISESKAVITYGTLPILKGNETELKQLFQNLLSNAIKFHKKDISPEIEINAKESNSEYLFTIKDNGIGFEEQYKERIFIIFQRLQNSAEYPGTGIGLATCKKIVEQHNGKIWVESELGIGSTFYFTISKNI